jgi:hypothetical protein
MISCFFYSLSDRKAKNRFSTHILSLRISFILLILISEYSHSQTIIGMGTNTPNPNAVLELVSETNNQGLLVPRMSTNDAAAFGSQLTSQDNGLLIFLEDKGAFYYWWNISWRTLEPTSPTSVPGSSMPALPKGHVWVGNTNNQPIALDASADAQILVGNGTTIASVTITGELELQADGTLTLKNTSVTTNKIADGAITTAKIANDAVTRDKIHANIAGSGLIQAANGSLQVANTETGELLIGQGGSVISQPISGDITLNTNGTTTITGIQGNPVNSTPPEIKDVLTWDGSAWMPASSVSGSNQQQWYAGAPTPTAGTPNKAVDGDYYYDTDNNIVSRKESGIWKPLGSFNTAPPANINTGVKADSYRTPILYLGDAKPVDGDDMGAIGDFYYSRTEEKLYYRLLDVSNGKIKWQAL